MVSLTTSELWWILPTWGMKFGFCSRCPKVSGNTSCKWSWGIRWMSLEIKYGDEKGLTVHFPSFLSLMDCSMAQWFHMTCWEKNTAFFLWCSWPAWEHTILYLLSILPYFISLLSLDLAALDYTSQYTLVFICLPQAISQGTSSMRISISNGSCYLSFVKFMKS